MIELILAIILFLSFTGIVVIIWRKIPILVELSEKIEEGPSENFWLKLKEKIKNTPLIKTFSFEVFLQKILSKIRVLSLKIENKIALWLQILRERTKKKKIEENDNYWQEFKKLIKKKDKRR